LRLSLDGARFTYAAGQAALLGVTGQPDQVPYSIASAPADALADRYLEFLVKVEPGDAAPHLTGLARGGHVTIRGPVGSFVFPPQPEERHFLFVAGGTGIAPLRAMIRQAYRTHLPGRVRLRYSARTPTDFAYLPELRRYAREKRLEMVLTATREVPRGWRGERGRITPDRLAPLLVTPETLCFVCGPASMVDAVPRMLMTLGVARRRIRIEEW
jgi:ferredoxin-NADP reductase